MAKLLKSSSTPSSLFYELRYLQRFAQVQGDSRYYPLKCEWQHFITRKACGTECKFVWPRIRVLQRTEPTGYRHRDRYTEIEIAIERLKKWAHVITEAGKFKIYRMGYQTGEPGTADNAVQVGGLSAGKTSSSLPEVSLMFCQGLPLIEWGPTLPRQFDDKI